MGKRTFEEFLVIYYFNLEVRKFKKDRRIIFPFFEIINSLMIPYRKIISFSKVPTKIQKRIIYVNNSIIDVKENNVKNIGYD